MDKVVELHSKENISNICKAIVQLSELGCPKDHIEKYAKILQVACYGPEDDKFSSFYGAILSPVYCLGAILNVKGFSNELKRNPEKCMQVILCILNIHELNPAITQFLEETIPILLDILTGEQRSLLVQSVYDNKDLSCSLVEAVTERDGGQVLGEVLEGLVVTERDLGTGLWARLLKWGTSSSLLFTWVSGLLLGIDPPLAKTYSSVVASSVPDPVLLYPPLLRPAAVLLSLSPSLFTTSPLLTSLDSHSRLLLASHFLPPHQKNVLIEYPLNC